MCQKDHGCQQLILTNPCGDRRVDRETTMSRGSSPWLTPSGEGKRPPCGAMGDAIGERFGTDYSRLDLVDELDRAQRWRPRRP